MEHILPALEQAARRRVKLAYHRLRHFRERTPDWQGIFFHDHFGRKLSFTFDDGPRREYTLRVSELLREWGVPGTFFALGHRVRTYPEILRMVDQAGHHIGNHSFTHASFARLSLAEMAEEIDKTRAMIDFVLKDRYPDGYPHRYFRPPWGLPWTRGGSAPARRRLMRVLAPRGLKLALWQVDAGDWSFPPPLVIQRRIREKIHPPQGGVVLFHDSHEGVIPALDHLIDELAGAGYAFRSLEELEKHRVG